MTVIEKMARAIQAAHANYENRMVWHWDEVTEPWKSIYLQMAKAALSALEEPSDDMISRGLSASGYSASGRDEVAWIFKRMIRAAKGEQG